MNNQYFLGTLTNLDEFFRFRKIYFIYYEDATFDQIKENDEVEDGAIEIETAFADLSFAD